MGAVGAAAAGGKEAGSAAGVVETAAHRRYPVADRWRGRRRCARTSRSWRLSFDDAKTAAGLPEELDLHCLRHSYVTHLVEFDYPQRFVQEQVGHVYASTTAIYTGVSDEYRNRLLQRSLAGRHPDVMERTT